MRNLSYVVVVWLMIGLFGCAPWVHPYKTQNEFYTDKAECSAMAGQARGSDFVWSLTFNSCMKGRGYRVSSN